MPFVITQNNASTSSSSRNENLFPRVATSAAAKSDGVAAAAESRDSPPVAQSSPLNPEVQYQVNLNERTQTFGATAIQTPRKRNLLLEEDEILNQVMPFPEDTLLNLLIKFRY